MLFREFANPISFEWLLHKYSRLLFIWLSLLVSVAAYLAYHFTESYRLGLPDVKQLRQFEPAQTTRIYSKDHQLLATLYSENRTWVPLKEISPWMIKALIAVEDTRFYTHSGVDPIGVARAAYLDLTSDGHRQGASTITMQLARAMFLSPERTYERKFREALLAQELERQFSKNEILEFYLNQVYFGSGAYGVQAAASQYYNRSASKLTPAQAAMIAGLPKAPTRLSPLVDPQAARDRQMLVLTRMQKTGALTLAQYRRAGDEAATHTFRPRPVRQQMLKVPYFSSYVIKELSKRYSEEQLYGGGLNVYTTVDLKLQKAAEQAVSELVAADEYVLNVHQAALVTLDNRTGYILAMVGGRGFTTKNQFNRAWQSRRQTGSSFKPIVYAAALENGYTPNTIVDDSPVSFKIPGSQDWAPKNADGRFMGKMPLWLALQHSRNVISARIVQAVGPARIVELAARLGIDGLAPSLSLALGTAEVSPLQMASTFSVFPNDGVMRRPTAILTVSDPAGQILEDNRRLARQVVMTEWVARAMTWMMCRVVDFGTATQAALADRPVAGKTGTTDSYRDAWFVGFTPE